MIVFITLCAICGVLIVCFIPAPLWIQMLIAYAVSQVIFLLSKTTMAPMISAIVLPVMLQTRSIIYIISAFLLTIFVVIIRWVMEKKGLKLSVVYRPVDSLNKERDKANIERPFKYHNSFCFTVYINNDLYVRNKP